MLAIISIPLGLAIWRLWSVQRPRVIAVSFVDQQAFLYQLGEGLRNLGFQRLSSVDGHTLYNPPAIQRLVGTIPIAVDVPSPGTARITASNAFMRQIKRWFPDSVEQKYTGPIPIKRWFIGVGKIFLGGVIFMVLLFGGLMYFMPNGPGGSTVVTATQGFDIERALAISAFDASHGVQTDIDVAATGQKLHVKIPPGVKSGTRLRFRGQGKPGQGGAPNGDLLVVLEVR